jgi:hypothetical protein
MNGKSESSLPNRRGGVPHRTSAEFPAELTSFAAWQEAQTWELFGYQLSASNRCTELSTARGLKTCLFRLTTGSHL